jgi:hypothetical protein
MCCGQKRVELRNGVTTRTTQSIPQSAPGSTPIQISRPQSHVQPRQQTVQRYTSGLIPRQSPPITTAETRSNFNTQVTLRYLGQSPIRVQGSQTGRYYEFTSTLPVRAVYARDATSLLNTRFFRRA